MLSVIFNTNRDPLKVLCLGAHCDDIEIGCGGTLLRLIAEHHRVEVMWVVFCSNDIRAAEARNAAHSFLNGAVKQTVTIKDQRDGFLPYYAVDVKEFFEELKNKFSPDLIFTHYRDDRHQDHRLISDLTWNTWRDHVILEYEIPKYDGDLGSPNFFVSLSESLCSKKAELVFECFPSQKSKHWFQPETFLSLARIRGIESCAPESYAEGFYARKIVT